MAFGFSFGSGEDNNPAVPRKANPNDKRLDVFELLPGFSWRGIPMPVLTRSMQFQHTRAEHPFVYRDKSLVEPMGQRNLVFSYTLPFREAIATKKYANLFTGVLPKFRKAFEDGSAGELSDPFYGVVRVVPDMWQEHEAQGGAGRDGIDVTVTFYESPEDTEGNTRADISVRGVQADAIAIDDAWKFAMAGAPGVDTSAQLASPFDAILAYKDQADRYSEKVVAALGQVFNRAKTLEAAIVDVWTPDKWPMRAALREIQIRAYDLSQQLSTRTTKQVTTDADATVASLAKRYKMTLRALIELNPDLAATPLVPAGTTFTVTVAG